MADDIFLGKYILTITGFIIMLFNVFKVSAEKV